MDHPAEMDWHLLAGYHGRTGQILHNTRYSLRLSHRLPGEIHPKATRWRHVRFPSQSIPAMRPLGKVPKIMRIHVRFGIFEN